MTEFYLVAALLIAVAAYFVIFPPMMARSPLAASRQHSNVEVFKQRLAELEIERDSGNIDEADYQPLKTELQRRLLEDVSVSEVAQPLSLTEGQPQANKPSLALQLGLFVLIAVLSVALYQQIGAKPDWEIKQLLSDARIKAANGAGAQAEVAQLIERLNRRLEQRPEDSNYLMMLATTQMELQHYTEATSAYQRMLDLYPEDPTLLGHYAQALYLSSGRKLTPAILAITDQALALNPQQSTVLGMLGIAHFEAGNFQQAVSFWQRLLPVMQPSSPNRQLITAGIARAQELMAQQGLTPAEGAVQVETVAAASGASLQVKVAIAESLEAAADASVFIFARAAKGPRMPLAVVRMTVADLPATITLDDSMAMAPGMSLSSFAEVEVVARISTQGIANPSAGDMEGSVGPVVVASAEGTLELVISRVLP